MPLIDLGPWQRVGYGVSTLLTALFLLACSFLPEPSKHFWRAGGTRASIGFDGVITFTGIIGMGLIFVLFLCKKSQPATA